MDHIRAQCHRHTHDYLIDPVYILPTLLPASQGRSHRAIVFQREDAHRSGRCFSTTRPQAHVRLARVSCPLLRCWCEFPRARSLVCLVPVASRRRSPWSLVLVVSMSQPQSTSAAGSAAVAHSNQTANGQQPSTTKAPQPTVKPTFSFAGQCARIAAELN